MSSEIIQVNLVSETKSETLGPLWIWDSSRLFCWLQTGFIIDKKEKMFSNWFQTRISSRSWPYFQCWAFKASPLLINCCIKKPYLSGIHNVKQLEVNFIRPVERFTSEEIHCINHSNPKIFNCWVIEFSLKVDTTTKLVNTLSFDQAITEGNDFKA